MQKIWILIMGTLLAAGAYPASLHAAQLASGEQYTVANGQTINQNLYAAGNGLNIAGTIAGDAYLAGSTITIGGTIQKDLNAAAGTLTMNGTVQEDMRLAGGTIIITGSANGDVMLFGGQITVAQNAKLSGDIYLNGGQVTIDGTVIGPLTINAGSVSINGTIEGPVTITADDVQLHATAVIKGDLKHKGPRETSIAQGAQITGSKSFIKSEERQSGAQTLPFLEAWWLTKVAMMLVAALVLFLLFQRHTETAVSFAGTTPWKALIHGFVLLIMLPIASLLLMITMIGLPFAFILICLYIASLILASILATIITGSYIYTFVMKKKEQSLSWHIIVVGVVVLYLIRLVPIVGWVIGAGMFLIALGTLWTLAYQAARKNP